MSKFRLNGRVWKIQYEGLRKICFKCGHLGHKDEQCPKFKDNNGSNEATDMVTSGCPQHGGDSGRARKPEEQDQFGTWMLVQRNLRRGPAKPKGITSKQTDTRTVDTRGQEKQQTTQTLSSKQTAAVSQPVAKARSDSTGSRFAVLGQSREEGSTAGQDMEMENPESIEESMERNNTKDPASNKEGELISKSPSETTKVGEDQLRGNVNITGKDHEDMDGEFMESIPITVDLASNTGPSYKERRYLNNWKEDQARGDPLIGERNNLPLRETITLNNSDGRLSRDSKERIVHILNNTPTREDKENFIKEKASTPHLSHSSRKPLDLERVIQLQNHESIEPPDYVGAASDPSILDVHRLRNGRPINGQGASSSPQGGTANRLVPSTPTRSTSIDVDSSTPVGADRYYERSKGHVYGYSA